MATSSVPFEEVFEEELHEIRKRRRESGMWTENEDKVTSDAHLKEDLAGLALSGGGVRSAALNLGLVQSMYTSGKLKLVDYLSTVSGGGYSGALVSTEAAKDPDGVEWAENDDRNRLSIESSAATGQPRRVYEIAMHGRRMGNVLKMLSRHLYGWIVTLAFIISGLVTSGSLLAWIMCSVSSRENMVFLRELGFSGDIGRAFFPAFLALLLWLTALLITKLCLAFSVKTPPTSRLTYIALLTTLTLGMISILGMGEVSMKDLIRVGNVSASWEAEVNRMARVIGMVLSILFATIIAPYLMPTKLLQSGVQKENLLQRAIFNTAGYGLLIGAPLVVFYALSTENISGAHDLRVTRGDLIYSNLNSFREFSAELESTSASSDARKKSTKFAAVATQNLWTQLDWLSFVAGPYDLQSSAQRMVRLEASQKTGHSSQASLLLWKAIKSVDDNGRVEYTQPLVPPLDEPMTQPRPNTTSGIKTWARLEDERVEKLNTLSFRHRWMDYLSWQLSPQHQSDPFGQRIKDGMKLNLLRQSFANAITTQCLSDPNLFAIEWKSEGGKKAEQVLFIDARPFHVALASQWLASDDASVKQLIQSASTLVEHNRESANLIRLIVSHRYFDQVISAVTAQHTYPKTMAEAETHVDLLGKRIGKHQLLSEENTGIALSWLYTNLPAALEQYRSEPPTGQNVTRQAEFLSWLNAQTYEIKRVTESTRMANWRLLCARFPNYVTAPDLVYSSHVNYFDQNRRLTIAAYFFVAFVVIGLWSNLNVTCLHGVYRDELAAIWLRDPKTLLKDLDTCAAGAPMHLINCTLNHLSSREDPDPERRSRFVFNNRFCGSKLTGYRETELYQDGETTVADAIAISGAAVSTSNAGNILYRIMLMLTNFRMGQWVRNPSRYMPERYWPSPLRCISSLFWDVQERPYCFLSDGGHLDNTGLSALLERHCRLMIVGDASDDSNYKFADIRKVLQAARGKYNLEFEPLPIPSETKKQYSVGQSLEDLREIPEDGFSRGHFVAFRVRYAKKDRRPDGLLIIAKSTVTGDEPVDIVELRRNKEKFPHDPTSNQFLSPDRFESYVMLGRHIGDRIVSFLNHLPPLPGTGSSETHSPVDLVPPQWRRTSKAEQGEDVKRTEAHCGAKANEHTAFKFRDSLNQEPPFDSVNIDKAGAMIVAWAQGANGASDDDLRRIHFWVTTYATNNSTSTESKKQLCQFLISATLEHSERINSSDFARSEFLSMLNLLENKRMKNYTEAVMKIATHKANKPSTERTQSR